MRDKFLYIIISTVLLAGCRIDNGGSFNPTALGYSTAHSTLNEVYSSVVEMNTMLRLDEYITAADEAERIDIQDKYFYSQRIVERSAGEWHIISSGDDVTVSTGGRSLREAGARWSFTNTSESINTVIENISDESGELYAYYAEHGKESYYLCSVMDLTIGFVTDNTPVRHEYISVEGGGEILRYSGNFTFEILNPLLIETEKRRFESGRMTMTSVIDGVTYSPEAVISEHYITISGGRDNAYVKDYPYNGYY